MEAGLCHSAMPANVGRSASHQPHLYIHVVTNNSGQGPLSTGNTHDCTAESPGLSYPEPGAGEQRGNRLAYSLTPSESPTSPGNYTPAFLFPFQARTSLHIPMKDNLTSRLRETMDLSHSVPTRQQSTDLVQQGQLPAQHSRLHL